MRKLIYILLFIPLLNFAQVPDLLQLAGWQANNGFDSGLVINGTLDDATDVSVGTGWSVGSGVAYFDKTLASSGNLGFVLSGNIISGETYDFEFDMVSEGTQGRFRVQIQGVSTTYYDVIGYTTYTEGHITINFTNSFGEDCTFIRIGGSSSGTPDSFTVDNVSLINIP